MISYMWDIKKHRKGIKNDQSNRLRLAYRTEFAKGVHGGRFEIVAKGNQHFGGRCGTGTL